MHTITKKPPVRPFSRKGRGGALLVVVLLLSLSARTYCDIIKQPATNLGGTSFMDGFARPGTLFQITAEHYKADSFKDAGGDSIPGDNEIVANVLLLQWTDLTEHKIGNAYYGWEVLLPVADVNPDTDLPGLNQGETGLGDLYLSPLVLQWTDSTLFGKPYFHRLNAVFSLPTGDYDRNNDVNIGTNTWRFNPHYAGTLLLSPEWEVSFRLHYLWSSENDDPHPFAFAGADDIQAGSAFHANYATSYELSQGLRIGVAGYYLNQLNDDRINGDSQANSREKVIGLGPGLIWQHRNTLLTVNGYAEFGAENRTEGYRVVARYAWMFQ